MATYYISSSLGNDVNAGTFEAPWASCEPINDLADASGINA